MKRLIPAATALVVAAVFSILPENVTAGPAGGRAGVQPRTQAPLVARLALRDGTSRLVTLDGVGCSETICSRVAVNTLAVGEVLVNRTHFDTISAVREITDTGARFVFKDGTSRQLSVVPDNRVLYIVDTDGRTRKFALGAVSAIEFVSSDQR